MAVLVIHATRLGSTREIAERIAERLQANGVDALALAADDPALAAGLPERDGYVIGSAVYAGHWLAPAVRFVERHRDALALRPTWLFSSGPVGRTAITHAPVEPREIATIWSAIRPRDHVVFGGALDRGDLADADFGRLERFVAERFVPEGDYRDWSAIDTWADDIARALGASRSIAPAGRSTVA